MTALEAMNFARALLIVGAALAILYGVALAAGKRELHRHPAENDWQRWSRVIAEEWTIDEGEHGPRCLPKGRQ